MHELLLYQKQNNEKNINEKISNCGGETLLLTSSPKNLNLSTASASTSSSLGAGSTNNVSVDFAQYFPKSSGSSANISGSSDVDLSSANNSSSSTSCGDNHHGGGQLSARMLLASKFIPKMSQYWNQHQKIESAGANGGGDAPPYRLLNNNNNNNNNDNNNNNNDKEQEENELIKSMMRSLVIEAQQQQQQQQQQNGKNDNIKKTPTTSSLDATLLLADRFNISSKFYNQKSLNNNLLKFKMLKSAIPGGGVSALNEIYSRKVFVGGLPPDIDEHQIALKFGEFGSHIVDWPHKLESTSCFPPKGFAFLLYHQEQSVRHLIDACLKDDSKLYMCISSPTIKDKPVQIRPWRLSDSDFLLDPNICLDNRKMVFVGGVPRPLKAFELALILDRYYGGVCYASIDIDSELKYPKGAGRVAFSNQQSYIAAISARFVHLQYGDIDKRVEVKPYVLDDQICDECNGARCGAKYAPYFCSNITCLQYFCEHCWVIIHTRPGREFHKPLVKEGTDRPRTLPFNWS